MWIIDLLKTAVANRRFIVINTFVVTVAAIIISLLLPREYRGVTTILPPESQSSFGALGDLSMSQIAMAVTNFTLPVMATPSDLYASMLTSETVLSKVVDSFDLVSVYDVENNWVAVDLLRENVHVEVENEGIITVEAIANSAELAADIANALVSELNSLNIEIQNRRGGQHVTFLSSRLTQAEDDLQKALNELRQFQERHMAVSLELQSAALIENLADLKGKLTFEEVELELRRKNYNPDHPDLIGQQQRVNELRRKLGEIEMGAETQQDSVLSALDIPLSRIPDLSLQFSILRRNVLIQEKLYELLAQQLEMSRITEQRDTPVISVLDSARPPLRHFKPRKTVIVVVAFMLSLLVSISIAVVRSQMSTRDSLSGEVLSQIRETVSDMRRKPLG